MLKIFGKLKSYITGESSSKETQTDDVKKDRDFHKEIEDIRMSKYDSDKHIKTATGESLKFLKTLTEEIDKFGSNK